MHNFYDHYPLYFMASNSVLRIRIIFQHFVSFISFCFIPTNKWTEVTRIFGYTCTSIHRVDRWSSRARRCLRNRRVGRVGAFESGCNYAADRKRYQLLFFAESEKCISGRGEGEGEGEGEDFIFQSTPNSLTMCIVNLPLFRTRPEEGGRSQNQRDPESTLF